MVGLRDVANHEEHIGYTHGKTGSLRAVGLVSASHAQSIVNCFLSTSLQSFFEHIIIEFVKRDELAQLSLSIVLGSRVDNLDDASFVTFYLLGNIAEVEERVEYLHNQLELIRYEWVVVYKIVLRFVATIGCGQFELKVETCLIFIVECSELRFHFLFLVENTLLGDYLRLCAFEGNLHFEASLNFAFLILFFGNVTIVHNF